MDDINRKLAAYQKKTISLRDLERMFQSNMNTYEQFAATILQLEDDNILTMIKSKGRTARTPSIAFQYRINKSLLFNDFHKELQQYRSSLVPIINLDEYYRLDVSEWKKDLPFIIKINAYLKENSLPKLQVPAPERSYELVGDEKWIVEKKGKELLERIGLYDKLKIIPVSEPLMFAINPYKLDQVNQFHLIVENKTTYQGLLLVLQETIFSSLIYGRGKTIIGSIEQFANQYPIQANHLFFYFGDLDREGIAIWHSLNKRITAKLALPFYEACLNKTAANGKEYQRENVEAIESFLASFQTEEKIQIRSLLQNGKYYPQETLKTMELQQIWRDTDWTGLI